MSVLEIKNLSYIYNKGLPSETIALKNINLSINAGEVVGIIGKTGSGKSTLVQLLNGLIEPTSGNIHINGKELKGKNKSEEVCLDVGLVFQYPEYQLFEETVYKDIAFGPRNKGFTEEKIKEQVYNSIKFVGLDESFLERSPFELSGGEKRKVAIAGIIAMEPSILILDEPTAGLDPMGREELMCNIINYHKARKNTVIFISHIMEDIARVSDRVLVMNEGEIFDFDTPKNIFSRRDELQKIGLNIPQITKIVRMIKEKGYDINDKVVTIEQGEESLIKLIKGRKEK